MVRATNKSMQKYLQHFLNRALFEFLIKGGVNILLWNSMIFYLQSSAHATAMMRHISYRVKQKEAKESSSADLSLVGPITHDLWDLLPRNQGRCVLVAWRTMPPSMPFSQSLSPLSASLPARRMENEMFHLLSRYICHKSNFWHVLVHICNSCLLNRCYT